MTATFDAVRHQVMWNRLLSVVEEQAQTLVRTAFSTSAREAGDISAGVFDLTGRMLAQAVTGTPGHVNSMALSVGHFVEKFPPETMREGDVFITNDPWKGTGHLNDFTVVSPTFRDGRIVALFASTSHVVDVGGLGQGPDARQVYQEGLFVPLMPFAEAGRVNEWFLEMVRANVREPRMVIGDLYALAACNDTGSERLLAMMDEYGLEDLATLADFIVDSSRRAMADAIGALPQGSWSHSMTIDGFDREIELVARLTVADGTIDVDFDGTSGLSDFGINCPLCYTIAYTSFGVKCIVAPELPNNAGALDAIRVTAPEGSILNPPHPCAVYARSNIGHMLPDVAFGCLYQAIPDQVPAEGCSALWTLRLGAGQGITARAGSQSTPFQIMSFHSGGAGARPGLDGLSATPFPSGVRNVPVEATEAITPLVFWKKELRPDSGGAGRTRGGLGQTIEVENREGAPFGIYATFERTVHAARGRGGGGPGALGRLSLGSGRKLRNKGFQVVPEGERLVVEMPGGGGLGDPAARDPAAIEKDVRRGLVSPEAAARDYGFDPDSSRTSPSR